MAPPVVHQRARGRDRQQRGIDGFALQRSGGIRQRLQRQHFHLAELETVFVGEQAERIVEAGADLRHRHAFAGEILWRLQPGGIGIVAGEIADQGIAGLLAAHAADHLQRALAGEIIEPRGEGGDAEIDVARGGRHRDRLRRVEEFQLDVEPGLAEIALVLRDEHRRRRRQPEHADLGLQRIVGAREPARGHRQQASEREPRKTLSSAPPPSSVVSNVRRRLYSPRAPADPAR